MPAAGDADGGTERFHQTKSSSSVRKAETDLCNFEETIAIKNE